MIRKIEIDLAPEEWRELEAEAQLFGLSLTELIRRELKGLAAVPDRQEGNA